MQETSIRKPSYFSTLTSVMCVCMCVCTYVCEWVHALVLAHVRIYTSVRVWRIISLHTYTFKSASFSSHIPYQENLITVRKLRCTKYVTTTSRFVQIFFFVYMMYFNWNVSWFTMYKGFYFQFQLARNLLTHTYIWLTGFYSPLS